MTREELKELGGIGGLFIMFFAVLALPYAVLAMIGPAWAVLAGLICPVVWFLTMPTTCMSGGLIYSILGIGQIFAGLAWIVIGIVRLVKWIAT